MKRQTLRYVPDQYKTQEMYNGSIAENPQSLQYVPDHQNTKNVCKKAVGKDP